MTRSLTEIIEDADKSFKEVIVGIEKYIKTNALIKELADDYIEWSEEDVKEVIRRTDSMEFTIGDVDYARRLAEYPIYNEYMKRVNYLIDYLPFITSRVERNEFYKNQIVPLKICMSEAKHHIKLMSNDLKFYESEDPDILK